METSQSLSLVIPVFNEEGNVRNLIERLHKSLFTAGIRYELIFIDDNSTDKTWNALEEMAKWYPVRLHKKKRERGKARSILEGAGYAKYAQIGVIDADLQYPPEIIPEMFQLLHTGKADIVVADRREYKASKRRRIISYCFRNFFGKYLHGLTVDVQSGLKLFRKEIIERLALHPSPWAFDLEFLVKARDAGYRIDSVPIVFEKRYSGKPKIGMLQAVWQIGISAIRLAYSDAQIIPFHPETLKAKGNGFHYKGMEFVHHTTLHHKQSAFFRLSNGQALFLSFLFMGLLIGLAYNWHATIVGIITVLTFIYFADLLFYLFLIYRSFSRTPEITVSEEELAKIPDSSWPAYTILCPLYKEWRVVPQFVSAINSLSYPKEKLQAILLLEEDDQETIDHVRKMSLPPYIETAVVPHSLPKTKPKALNWGIARAKGEYVVIYDAEDVPDPFQLKKAIVAFTKADSKTICIQAKLNFYNPNQNILTRVFTAEYSLWFDLVLTGLQSIKAPIPLGGTSNHFRKQDLISLKGWDSFNVTEDCDLGMRLVTRGYSTAVMDSQTLEEANSSLANWFGQRTRWIKGYIQTYLVHMRSPVSLLGQKRKLNIITFQLIVGGKIFSMFINPLMWVMTISYFMFRPVVGPFIESLFPPLVFYMAAFSLVLGNFLYLYYYMIGCAKRGYDDIMKYVFLVPLYWLAMSIAAWKALWQVIVNPHYWHKTKHGLHLNSEKTSETARNNIESVWGPQNLPYAPAFSQEAVLPIEEKKSDAYPYYSAVS